MKRPAVLLVAALVACWLVVRLSLGRGRGGHPPRAARPASAEKHYVTPRQLSAAGGLARRRLAPFAARAHDGRTLRWPDFASGRALVLVFLKAGCPCNDDFEPFCRRLHRAYGDRVAFACLIDGGPAAALAHAERHRCPYPVLCDPGKEVLARFGAENGGYVALLTADGVLDTVWPGWSREMFAELGRRAAAVAGVPERPLDPAGLPSALMTGCPYSS